MRTIDNETLYYINICEKVTRTRIKDIIKFPEYNKLTIVMERGGLNKLLKNDGMKKLRNIIKEPFTVVEYSEDIKNFMSSLCHWFKYNSINIEDKKITISVNSKDKGKIIGKNASNLKWMKDIINVYFGEYNIYIE